MFKSMIVPREKNKTSTWQRIPIGLAKTAMVDFGFFNENHFK